METVKRIRLAMLAFAGVIVVGTAGYLLLGFTVMDALYQTVTTVTTVGFREVHPLSTVGKVYTIAVILVGVGTALYAFGVVLEALVEGDLRQYLKGRRMSAEIDGMSTHVIICGWGRVGRSSADYLQSAGHRIVIVDRDPERLTGIGHPLVLGDVTDDQVLDAAGISRAHALLAALDTDADNVYVTLSSRASWRSARTRRYADPRSVTSSWRTEPEWCCSRCAPSARSPSSRTQIRRRSSRAARSRSSSALQTSWTRLAKWPARKQLGAA